MGILTMRVRTVRAPIPPTHEGNFFYWNGHADEVPHRR